MAPTVYPPNVQNCFCCPFGYHIDLDFVQYCESLALHTEGNSTRRRPKRRQSMEVMLGLQDSLKSIKVKYFSSLYIFNFFLLKVL